MNVVPLWIAGEAWTGRETLAVHHPFDGALVGRVAAAGAAEVDRAVAAARAFAATPSRAERSAVLFKAEGLLGARAEATARLITQETGLAIREARYEVGRARDVLRFAGAWALEEDGEIFAGDASAQGKSRKIFSIHEPLLCAAAITPFNHPLNQVVHKIAPAVAAGTPLVLKPSEKTPLTALTFAAMMYEAGLPGGMLSVLVGPIPDVAERVVRHAGVEALSFVGSTEIGVRIASQAGYKKVALELGGNSPLIVAEDADLGMAATLAAEGSFRNSGQRCTAVKRILVHRAVLAPFTARLAALAKEYVSGDPMDEATKVGTVISDAAAAKLEGLIRDAVEGGARVLVGGTRRGALLAPTVMENVPRTAEIACREAFGPIAKILPVEDLGDAIALANATEDGLSAAVCTRSLETALAVVRGVRTGMVNVNEVPGYRTEVSPFGGVKMSGTGVKEGVREATRWLSNVKTFSLPW